MTCRERVHTILRHEQPDICPWSIGFTQGALKSLIDYTGDEQIVDKLGNHTAGYHPSMPNAWVEVAPGIMRDEFGVTWDRSHGHKDIGNPDGKIFPEPRLGDYVFPDPADPARWEVFEAQMAEPTDKFRIMDIGFSLFERAWTMRGMENLLMDMIIHPEFVDELLERITEFNLVLVRRSVKYDIDAVGFGDDWGQQLGMIMGPKLWRRFIKPHLARMYGAAHEGGKYVFIHSCGKVDEVFPELIEIGLNCFNPFQPEVMDVYEMKRLYGDRLSFNGGVSTQKTLPYGTPAEVTAEVQRLIKEIGKNGGYICAPAHAIPGDAKPENMVALLEAVHNQ